MKTLIETRTRKQSAEKLAKQYNKEHVEDGGNIESYYAVEKTEDGVFGVFKVENSGLIESQQNEPLNPNLENDMPEAFKVTTEEEVVIEATEEGQEPTTETKTVETMFLDEDDANDFAGENGSVEKVEITQEELEELARQSVEAEKQKELARAQHNANIAEGVKKSWEDKEVRAARTSRIGIKVAPCKIVTENEKTTAVPVEGEGFEFTEFASVKKAFDKFGLNVSKFVAFRAQLRCAGSLVYQEGEKAYLFEVTSITSAEDREKVAAAKKETKKAEPKEQAESGKAESKKAGKKRGGKKSADKKEEKPEAVDGESTDETEIAEAVDGESTDETEIAEAVDGESTDETEIAEAAGEEVSGE